MRTLCFAVLALVIAAEPIAAAPSPNDSCTFATATAMVARYGDIPEPIRKAIGTMADRDGAFQITDVVIPGQNNPGRRLIRAGQRGANWFVWYEAGGVAYSWHVAAFRLDQDATMPKVLLNAVVPVAWAGDHWAPKDDVCRLIEDALAGRAPAPASTTSF